MSIDYQRLAGKYVVSERAVQTIARSLSMAHGRHPQFSHDKLDKALTLDVLEVIKSE